MTRVILHPGFHKTGTTTVQMTLKQNRRALRPHLRIVLRPEMVAACDAARAFSARHDPLDLALFQYELAQLAESWAPDEQRPVLIASEDLCGRIPGRNGLKSYAAAPRLMQVLAETLAAILPAPRLVYFLSTRAAKPWLASCYMQNLRASRITETSAEYARKYRDSANLNAVADRIADVVAPHPLHRCALENSQDRPLGPLDPILDLIGLPRDVRAGLKPHPNANLSLPSSLAARLLELNRSDRTDAAVHAAKQALIRGLS
jgi:hypothetical protein